MKNTLKEIGGYKILEQIGSGGMSTVYKAYDPLFDRIVAVKRHPFENSSGNKKRLNFFATLKIVAALNHPSILPVYDYGEGGDFFYQVTRFMQRGTLNNLIHKDEAIPSEKIYKIIAQIGSALDFVHLKGILHLDVKPENILLDENENAFLDDFGIAKIINPEFNPVEGSIGSPLYMSPEQATGEVLDHRSDIYSLGVLLFELLTKRTPFHNESPVNVILAKVNLPAPAPSEFNSQITPHVDKIVSKALEILPEKRYQSARDLVEAFGSVTGTSKSI